MQISSTLLVAIMFSTVVGLSIGSLLITLATLISARAVAANAGIRRRDDSHHDRPQSVLSVLGAHRGGTPLTALVRGRVQHSLTPPCAPCVKHAPSGLHSRRCADHLGSTVRENRKNNESFPVLPALWKQSAKQVVLVEVSGAVGGSFGLCC